MSFGTWLFSSTKIGSRMRQRLLNRSVTETGVQLVVQLGKEFPNAVYVEGSIAWHAWKILAKRFEPKLQLVRVDVKGDEAQLSLVKP